MLDVGCGPGLLIPGLPGTVIGLDPVAEMLELLLTTPRGCSRAGRRRWSSVRHRIDRRCARHQGLVHVDRPHLLMALAELHRVVKVGGPIELQFFAGDQDLTPLETDPMGGRRFTGCGPTSSRWWSRVRVEIEALTIRADDQVDVIDMTARGPSPCPTSSALGCACSSVG